MWHGTFSDLKLRNCGAALIDQRPGTCADSAAEFGAAVLLHPLVEIALPLARFNLFHLADRLAGGEMQSVVGTPARTGRQVDARKAIACVACNIPRNAFPIQ